MSLEKLFLFAEAHIINCCSGYADRIRELMLVAKEIRIAGSTQASQNNENAGYFVEANHIEFKGVKVSGAMHN
jgi:hypothetical protein